MAVEFSNPPINEVVLATYFNPAVANLRNEHVGLLWEKIRYDFPTVQQQPPLPPRPGTDPNILGTEFFPMPRYWFVGRDDTYVIQIQKDAFIFNWRRRGSSVYPGFDSNIKPTFDKYYNLFAEFVGTEMNQPNLSIELCELTYINSIDLCDLWLSLEDTPNVIPSFSLPKPRADANPLFFNCGYVYDVGSDTTLNLGFRTVPLPGAPETTKLVVEIKLMGRTQEKTKPAADRWFQMSHDRVNNCFVNITSREMQERYWQHVEEAE